MISDVLHECVSGLDRYLNDPLYEKMYPISNHRRRLIALREMIEAHRAELDEDPPPQLTKG